MRRRGSHSEKMPRPTVAVVQGQQQRQQDDGRNIRRSSLPPSYHPGANNGGFPARQPQAPVGQGQHTQRVTPAPPSHNGMQWQYQQQGTLGQSSAQHHSFSSSMDLMVPANSTAHVYRAAPVPSFQSHLFRSSSHHTSHTAAAGDLLTMSRRALDAPPPNQTDGSTKKRASTMGDDKSHESNAMTWSTGNSHTMGQHPANPGNPQQPNHAPQHNQSVQHMGGLFPNNQVKPHFNGQASAAFQSAAYVSSSTIGSSGDNEDSHEHHRTIRPCRRSDSFEMMEDN